MHHLEVLVKAHEVLLKEPVLHHRVSLRHVYPQVEDAGLPLLAAVFVGLATQEGCLQVLLHVSHDSLLLHEVPVVLLLVSGVAVLFEFPAVL